MKNVLKKILTITLIITGSMPVVFTLVFHVQQQHIRHTMKERLEQQLLHTVTLPAQEVEWVKYKKEIHLAGRMFDIKSMRLEDGYYTFTGLYDDEETVLKKNLAGVINPGNKKINLRLIDFFQWLQSATTDIPHDYLFAELNPSTHTSHFFCSFKDPVKNIPTPPPQS